MPVEVIGVKVVVFRTPLVVSISYSFEILSAVDGSSLGKSEKEYKTSNGALYGAVAACIARSGVKAGGVNGPSVPKWRVDIVEFE